MTNQSKFFKLWLPVIIWTSLIFYLSSIPDLKTDLKYDFILRKIAHAVEYLILTFLLYRAFKGSFNISAFNLILYPAIISLLYAISDEIHQSFVVTRGCSARDVVIDSVGIICAIILVIYIRKRK